jgi:nitrate reductase alpha subunit
MVDGLQKQLGIGVGLAALDPYRTLTGRGQHFFNHTHMQ